MFQHQTLKKKLLVPILLIVLSLSFVVVWWTHQFFNRQLYKQVFYRAKELAHIIGFSAQIVHYPYELQRIVYAIGGEPNIKLIAVLTGEPLTVVATNKKSILGTSVKNLKILSVHRLPTFPEKNSIVLFNKQNHTFYYSLGFYLPNKENLHQYSKAYVLLQLDTHYTQQHVLQQSAKHTFVALLALIVLMLLAMWIIDTVFLAPLEGITSQMNRRRHGDKEARAPIYAKDEIGRLAQTLNEMIHAQEESENLFQKLVDIAPILLWISNKENQSFYFNRKWLEFTGQTEALQQGTAWMDSFHEECGKQYAEAFEKALAYRQPFSMECRVRHKNGGYRWMWSQSVPRVLSDGSFEGYIGCLVDITERKEVEKTLENYAEAIAKARDEALRSNQAKSTFLATMSHEIRTPMNGILGFLHLLKETPLNEEQYNYVQSIYSSSNLLLELISQILDISKIEAGKLSLDPVPFVLKTCLSEVTDIFHPMILKKQLQLIVNLQSTLPEYLYGDEKRLKQILINLLGNAIKFTNQGFIKLSIKGRNVEKGYRLFIAVQDTGSGIPQDAQKRIFKPFEQVASKTQGGTGLGLSIANSIIQLMDGTLKVRSQLERGSLFYFTIRMEALNTNAKALEIETKKIDSDSADTDKSSRIMLVEDNRENQVVLQKFLAKRGYSVTVVSNGKEALRELKLNDQHLLLMDVQMPEMDGYETTRRIRAGEAGVDMKNIPIIGLTAYAFKETRHQCLAIGMNELLTKPFKPNEVLSMIEKYLTTRPIPLV